MAWTEQPMETRLAYRRTEETALCSSGHVRNGILFIGRGLVYRKTEETYFSWSKRGPVDREWCGIPQKLTCVGALRSKRGSCSSGGVWHTAKRDSMGYYSSPLLTSSSLHGLLFIHRRPPPASTCDCSSTASPLLPPPATAHPRAPVHSASTAPSPATVKPALSTGSCSTTPPQTTVHPALHHTTGSCSSGGNATAHCSSKTPATLTVHPRGSIDRLQLAAVAKESLDRVQLTAINRSLGFS